MALLRVKKELRDFESTVDEFSENIFCRPVDGDLMHWEVVILGPKDSPYDGGIFFIDVTFPKDYPFKPPRMHFVTKIWHININSRGAIGLDFFNAGWSPALSVRRVCIAIRECLADPQWQDPLVPEVKHLFDSDRTAYEAKVREEVALHASSWEGAEWINGSRVVQVTGSMSEDGLIVTAMDLLGDEIARVPLDQGSKDPIKALRAELSDAMSIPGASIQIVLPTAERVRDIDPAQFYEKLLRCESEVPVASASGDKTDESMQGDTKR